MILLAETNAHRRDVTYDSRMTTDTNTWTRSVGNRSFAVVMKLVCHISESSTSTDFRLPGVGVDGKVLKIREVDDKLAIFSAETCCSRVS